MQASLLNWDALTANDILNLLQAREQAGQPAITPLLDCHQWAPLVATHNWQATGGFTSAQLRCLHPTSRPPMFEYWQVPVSSLPKHAHTAKGLRRYLAPALPPGSLGDIMAVTENLYCVAMPGLGDAFSTLAADTLTAWPPRTPPGQCATVASLRLDAVAGAIFHVSREEAQTAVEYGFVFLNFVEITKRSKITTTGDVLVFRGKGRAVLTGCQLNERSKRHWIEYELYPY